MRLESGFKSDGPQRNAWWTTSVSTDQEFLMFVEILTDLDAEMASFGEGMSTGHAQRVFLTCVATFVRLDLVARRAVVLVADRGPPSARPHSRVDPAADRESVLADTLTDYTTDVSVYSAWHHPRQRARPDSRDARGNAPSYSARSAMPRPARTRR